MKRLWAAIVLLAGFAAGLAIPAGAAPVPGLPGDLKACFNHHGVQFGSLSAYLCEVKLGDDLSGGLYFMPSSDNGLNSVNPSGQMLWYKLHAAPGAFFASETYNDPWNGSYLRAQSRVILFDEGPRGVCLVPLPSWTVDATGCRLISQGGAKIGPLHRFTPAEEFSWDEYALNMRAAIPLEYR